MDVPIIETSLKLKDQRLECPIPYRQILVNPIDFIKATPKKCTELCTRNINCKGITIEGLIPQGIDVTENISQDMPCNLIALKDINNSPTNKDSGVDDTGTIMCVPPPDRRETYGWRKYILIRKYKGKFAVYFRGVSMIYHMLHIYSFKLQ